MSEGSLFTRMHYRDLDAASVPLRNRYWLLSEPTSCSRSFIIPNRLNSRNLSLVVSLSPFDLDLHVLAPVNTHNVIKYLRDHFDRITQKTGTGIPVQFSVQSEEIMKENTQMVGQFRY